MTIRDDGSRDYVPVGEIEPGMKLLLAAGERVPVDGVVIGAIAVADELRVDAARTVLELHRAGVRRVVMLTGDAPAVAEAVAAELVCVKLHRMR